MKITLYDPAGDPITFRDCKNVHYGTDLQFEGKRWYGVTMPPNLKPIRVRTSLPFIVHETGENDEIDAVKGKI